MWSLRDSPAKLRRALSAAALLSMGSRKGSRCDRAAAITSTGSRQPNTAPSSTSLPMQGSTGSSARCSPVQGVWRHAEGLGATSLPVPGQIGTKLFKQAQCEVYSHLKHD